MGFVRRLAAGTRQYFARRRRLRELRRKYEYVYHSKRR